MNYSKLKTHRFVDSNFNVRRRFGYFDISSTFATGPSHVFEQGVIAICFLNRSLVYFIYLLISFEILLGVAFLK